ncbi:MAG: heme-copper oxidase subunit III [Actinobacteria bacterium]|nr:MAG: heme-copper oxidase subunit III [Actinomycetota bacterium]
MNEVTRSARATSGEAVARVARLRRSQPIGWWGMALFIATEAALFGTLLSTYYYLRLKSPVWPPDHIPAPSMALPLALTGVLVASALPMALANRAAQAGRAAPAWWALAVALGIQCAYLALQLHSFSSDLDKFGLHRDAYTSIYFTLLGAHHLHVLIGILLDGWLLARLPSGLTNYRALAVRVTALYWYFVSVLGTLVVVTQLAPSW